MTKVLIVDDAAFMRNSLRLLLERNDYRVCGEAENGKMAIEKYKELLPDIVTMDITMPEMNGVEAAREIIHFDPKATIIMVSAMGMETFVREAILSGAKGFVVKPFKEEAVLKALARYKAGGRG